MTSAREAYAEVMVHAYLETALMAESCRGDAPGCDFGGDCDRSLWDEGYRVEDISERSRAGAVRDIDAMLARAYDVARHYPADDIGYDLWMTRAGEGVGFWECSRPYFGQPHQESGRADGIVLDRAVKDLFREIDVVVGDDGAIHFEGGERHRA